VRLTNGLPLHAGSSHSAGMLHVKESGFALQIPRNGADLKWPRNDPLRLRGSQLDESLLQLLAMQLRRATLEHCNVRHERTFICNRGCRL